MFAHDYGLKLIIGLTQKKKMKVINWANKLTDKKWAFSLAILGWTQFLGSAKKIRILLCLEISDKFHSDINSWFMKPMKKMTKKEKRKKENGKFQ